jgi:uncharacterized membrane protein HdeD (DUF308 family)
MLSEVAMKRDMHFWLIVLIRGLISLLAGCFILVIPDMARTLLLLPIAVVISVLGLAMYGTIDSVLILISSFMTESRIPRAILLGQGAIGISIGVLLLTVVFEQVRLEWFLSLAAVQALCAGIGEVSLARHSQAQSISRWNYAAASVAFLAGVAYMVVRLKFAETLNQNQISWLVYGYLVAFGIAQCMTAARMLYADRGIFRPQ